jgi:hypothetical protein
VTTLIRAKLIPGMRVGYGRGHRRAVAVRLASYQKIVLSYPSRSGAIVLGLEKFSGPIVPKCFT